MGGGTCGCDWWDLGRTDKFPNVENNLLAVHVMLRTACTKKNLGMLLEVLAIIKTQWHGTT